MSNKKKIIITAAVELADLAVLVTILYISFPLTQFIAIIFVIALTICAVSLHNVRGDLIKENEKKEIECQRLNVKK